jgi:hypothetical protein
MADESKELVEQKAGLPTEVPMGFDDENDSSDLIVPRVKVINALSPERKDGIATEGEILNSLTKQKLNGQVFIPVFKFNNNIRWRDRSDGGGIMCIARTGKSGEGSDGTIVPCASCRRCEFDNSKQGKESLPSCTKYINFFGFFSGEYGVPIVLSFAKTSYNEGKKMYSLAKVSMQNIWNHGYRLESKKRSKNGNDWFIIEVMPNGPTSAEDRAYAISLYNNFHDTLGNMKYDMETNEPEEDTSAADPKNTEF